MDQFERFIADHPCMPMSTKLWYRQSVERAKFDELRRQREAEIVAEIVARNRRLLPCPYKRP